MWWRAACSTWCLKWTASRAPRRRLTAKWSSKCENWAVPPAAMSRRRGWSWRARCGTRFPRPAPTPPRRTACGDPTRMMCVSHPAAKPPQAGVGPWTRWSGTAGGLTLPAPDQRRRRGRRRGGGARGRGGQMPDSADLHAGRRAEVRAEQAARTARVPTRSPRRVQHPVPPHVFAGGDHEHAGPAAPLSVPETRCGPPAAFPARPAQFDLARRLGPVSRMPCFGR